MNTVLYGSYKKRSTAQAVITRLKRHGHYYWKGKKFIIKKYKGKYDLRYYLD